MKIVPPILDYGPLPLQSTYSLTTVHKMKKYIFTRVSISKHSHHQRIATSVPGHARTLPRIRIENYIRPELRRPLPLLRITYRTQVDNLNTSDICLMRPFLLLWKRHASSPTIPRIRLKTFNHRPFPLLSFSVLAPSYRKKKFCVKIAQSHRPYAVPLGRPITPLRFPRNGINELRRFWTFISKTRK